MNILNLPNVVFTVRGVRDASILLSDGSGAEPVEIVLGGWVESGNTRSMIRRGVQGHNPNVWPSTSGILSPTEDRSFWIYRDASRVEVGRVCAQ
jgi:hypothetical protein